ESAESEAYEYDFYEPYKTTLVDHMGQEQSSTASNGYEACEAYDSHEEDVDASAPEAGESPAMLEPAHDAEQDYHDRYPYGCGYEVEAGGDAEDTDASTPANVDARRILQLTDELAELVENAELVTAARARIHGLRQGASRLLTRVNMALLQRVVSHVMATDPRPGHSAAERGEGNVFLFEFEDVPAEFEMESTEPQAGEATETIAIEPSRNAVADHDGMAPWADSTLEEAQVTWHALKPELTRVAVEALARASLIGSVTVQR
ncbi:MAG: hypothetical protein ACODAD_12530, partial [Planctomycetota bacterium]